MVRPGSDREQRRHHAARDDILFDRIVAVNSKGTFNTLRAAAAKLRGGGRIVNFSSSVLKLAMPGCTVCVNGGIA